MGKRPLFSFPPNFGSYLALVFEFLGFLALGGVSGFVAQTYIWPEHSNWIFPAVFIAMFFLGLWFMVRQTKRLADKDNVRRAQEIQQDSREELSPEAVEKRMKDFDARFQKAFKHRGSKKERD